MLSLSRQATPTLLARPVAQIIRYSSSKSTTNAPTASSAPAPSKRPDPGLEKRRAARLAREAKLAQAQPKGPPKQTESDGNDFAPGTPRPSKPKTSRPRKPSRRDQVQSSGPGRGTERSRMDSAQPGAAEAIMAFTQREAARAPKVQTSANNDMEQGMGLVLPQFVGPEPIVTDIEALLDTVPNLISSVPQLPPSKKIQNAPADWIKQVYGGDRSQWRLDSQSYLKGARGPRSTYAKIILGRNPTIPWESQKQLIATIQKATKDA